MEKNDISEDLSQWEHIQSNDNNSINNKESIFPPNDNEGLPVSTPINNEQIHERKPLLSSRGDDDRKDGVERAESGVKKSKKLNLGVLNSDFFRIFLGIRKFDCFKVGLWSVSGVAAVVLVSLLHRRVLKWWKSKKMERKEYLLLLIKERPENKAAFTPNCSDERNFTCTPESSNSSSKLNILYIETNVLQSIHLIFLNRLNLGLTKSDNSSNGQFTDAWSRFQPFLPQIC